MSDLDELIDGSADPVAVRTVVRRLDGELSQRLSRDRSLVRPFVAVAAASHSLSRLMETDPAALDVLSALDDRPEVPSSGNAAAEPIGANSIDTGDTAVEVEELVRWKRREYLRIAARDLLGLDPVETTTALLADMATDVLASAVRIVSASDLAVIGMGKLGGSELNYASDIDVLFVGGEVRQARLVMEVARRCFRVDANLRPEGRDGPLTRSLESYEAYWERWASPWEFQALIKARPVAGDTDLGERWAEASTEALWGRAFTRDDLRSLRDMKGRSEAEVERKGVADREVKRGPGGLRDIEFSVQLLQLVHGRVDEGLRSPNTLAALREMAVGGYVDAEDAVHLADSYRFLRRVEHALQLDEELQTHTLPTERGKRRRVARILGYRGTPEAGPTEAFDGELLRQRNLVRSIHERLYFRPLLDALAGAGRLSPAAAEAALVTFGFTEPERVRQAARELTQGINRSSRMMQQLLPLLLDWLSGTPDPEGGLLGLRKLATGELRTRELASTFRESPEAARRLCLLLGTSALVGDVLVANPDLIGRLAEPGALRTLPRSDLVSSADRALGWRGETADRQQALRRWKRRHLLGVAARDIFGEADVDQVGTDLTGIAEACVHMALETAAPAVPFAVVALGRFAGAELAYGSDLDLVFVHGGDGATDQREAQRVAGELMRFLGGSTPAQRIFAVDPDLRPEGRAGPLARSLDGYIAYLDRWALTWERQAMARARPVAGDRDPADGFMEVLDRVVWAAPFTAEDEREVRRMKARIERERLPVGDDPDFHLKLGRGSLSDVEWTVQLLQLRHGIQAPGTLDGLKALLAAGAVTEGQADVLSAAYRFCERTRNRWWLVGSGPASPDALPQAGDGTRLARSLGTSPAGLRDDYRRVTRRSRQVMEHLFYGS